MRTHLLTHLASFQHISHLWSFDIFRWNRNGSSAWNELKFYYCLTLCENSKLFSDLTSTGTLWNFETYKQNPSLLYKKSLFAKPLVSLNNISSSPLTRIKCFRLQKFFHLNLLELIIIFILDINVLSKEVLWYLDANLANYIVIAKFKLWYAEWM